MKAAVYHAPRNITVEEIPLQHAGPDDIVVKVRASGICGSDLHGYRAGLWVEPGEVMGHEWAGEVVEVGRNVRHLKIGDRVTVGDSSGYPSGYTKSIGYGLPGAYAEYVRVPNAEAAGQVAQIPDELSFEEAATLEPLRCGFLAARLANPEPNDWAVVIGMGAIGLGVLQALKVCGACRVIAVDVSELRLKLARELGADFTINPTRENPLVRVQELTGIGYYKWGSQAAGRYTLGARADVVVDAAGKASTLVEAMEMVKHSGTVVQVSLFEEPVAFDPTIITQKQIRLQGSAGAWRFAPVADLVRTGRVRAKPLVTHRFPLERAVEAFETQMRADLSGKVIIDPWMKEQV